MQALYAAFKEQVLFSDVILRSCSAYSIVSWNTRHNPDTVGAYLSICSGLSSIIPPPKIPLPFWLITASIPHHLTSPNPPTILSSIPLIPPPPSLSPHNTPHTPTTQHPTHIPRTKPFYKDPSQRPSPVSRNLSSSKVNKYREPN